jgi:hypothetical protein
VRETVQFRLYANNGANPDPKLISKNITPSRAACSFGSCGSRSLISSDQAERVWPSWTSCAISCQKKSGRSIKPAAGQSVKKL